MKPSRVWALFALCLAVALAVMVWSTAMVLRLERTEAQAKAQALLEENARLALWRMDSRLTTLLAQESARPYFHYNAFYPAAGAYGAMYASHEAGAALLPSPLLREAPDPVVLLHFQLAPGQAVSSPQLPAGLQRARAIRDRHVTPVLLRERSDQLSALATTLRAPEIGSRIALRDAPTTAATPLPPPPADGAEPKEQQKLKSAKEYAMRQEYSQRNVAVQELESRGRTSSLFTTTRSEAPKPPAAVPVAKPVEITEGAMTPLWAGDVLLLARRVRVGDATYLQGCWLDWPRLQRELLDSVADLLPQASLLRANGTGPDEERRLASLPVRLVPGTAPMAATSFSPVQLSLFGAWLFLGLAALSVALLLHGVMVLSERRQMFVSAVTHELRTPLASARAAIQSLALGRVVEEKRARYLANAETDLARLSELVERVLESSRVSTARPQLRLERLDLAELLRERVPALAAESAPGLALELDTPESVLVDADARALETILRNLLANAGKYAAEPGRVRLAAARNGRDAVLTVRDFGAGVRGDPAELFLAFHRGAGPLEKSRPGVGLGLYLVAELARAHGGRATGRNATAGTGFEVEVRLPLAAES
jgi:signal transduction histidine kinase